MHAKCVSQQTNGGSQGWSGQRKRHRWAVSHQLNTTTSTGILNFDFLLCTVLFTSTCITITYVHCLFCLILYFNCFLQFYIFVKVYRTPILKFQIQFKKPILNFFKWLINYVLSAKNVWSLFKTVLGFILELKLIFIVLACFTFTLNLWCERWCEEMR